MPSQSSISVLINLPPRNCVLDISTVDSKNNDEIIALISKVRFTVSACEDEDLPLTYRYGYFMSEVLWENDVEFSSNGLNMDYLVDFTSSNIFDSVLPPSFINETNSQMIPILIMISVSDSLGGIANITKTINITS